MKEEDRIGELPLTEAEFESVVYSSHFLANADSKTCRSADAPITEQTDIFIDRVQHIFIRYKPRRHLSRSTSIF